MTMMTMQKKDETEKPASAGEGQRAGKGGAPLRKKHTPTPTTWRTPAYYKRDRPAKDERNQDD